MMRTAGLLLMFAAAAPAQYFGNVAGVVKDAATGKPLASAAVALVGNTNLKARTDTNGRFLIRGIPVDYPYTTYSVVASASGYKSGALEKVRVLPGAVMAVESAFALAPQRAGTSFDARKVIATFTYAHERPLRASARAETGKIFATREGLVGRTTANGHVIRSSDRFVALPSRRALNRRGERKFLVKVSRGSRSATVPVWDIGPWNIKDDYWSPPNERETWRGLRRGLPEAQAAYLDGFNGGRDGFGRKVLNPAGIDLSDAVFWNELGMKDNGWVAVEYLWDPSLISTRDPAPRGRTPERTRREPPRSLRDIIALAEAILIRARW